MRVLLVNDLSPDDCSGGGGSLPRPTGGGVTKGGHETDLFAGEVRHTGASRLFDLWDPRARERLVDT